MYNKIVSGAVLGLAAVASARPATYGSQSSSSSAAYATGVRATGTYPNGNSSAPAATGGAFKYPLANGFPEIKNPSAELEKINQQAGGQLSNKGPPQGLHDDSLNALAFVAFNELSEVAFFSELVANITTSRPGFTAHDIPFDRDIVLANLKVVLAQEELHELNANGAFENNTGLRVEPCTYNFNVKNFNEAIGLASLFTDVVLGTLPDIQTVAATAGDIGLIRGVGASLGEEGEQNGFYRTLLNKTPAQLPFLSGSARNFAYNAILQNFIVECPVKTTDLLENSKGGIPLNVTGKLDVLTKGLDLKDVTAEFSVQTVVASNTRSYYEDSSKSKMNYLTYINQQNKPLSVPIEDITFSENAIHFKASFPGKSEFLNGLTIAAVTEGSEFSDPQQVASATLFGPGLIEIN